MKKTFGYLKGVDLIFALAVFSYFFFIFFKYTLNIPLNDDYDVINNLNDILESNTFPEKIKLFYLQHNEHRILYDKFWFYISYLINPQGLNFNFLSFIGNLSLVVLVAFYYFKLRNEYSNYFILFPLSVFMFNLAFWENVTFSMACLSNFTFLVFALFSIHYLTKNEINNKQLFLSLLFFLLSIETQGGGIFLFPVALLIFIIKKDKINFIKYLFFGFMIIFIYFIDYQKNASPSIISIAENILLHLKFFFAFLGSAIANYHFFPDNNKEAVFRSFILGILFFITYLYLIIKQYYKQNLFNFSVMTYVIIISSVTSITRLSQGMDTAVASRYRLLSILFVISIFICLLEFFKIKNYKKEYANGIIIIICSVYVFLFSFNGTNESLMSFRNRISRIGMLNYFSKDSSLLNSPKTEFCAEVLNRANTSEVFRLNENAINNYYTFATSIELKNINYENPPSDISKIDTVKYLKDSYYIDGYTSLEGFDTKSQEVYIILSNNGIQKAFLAKNEYRPGLSAYFNTKNVDYGGFWVRIKKDDVSIEKSEIIILIQNEGTSKIIRTENTLIKE
jgi:uncharacterized membrane protein YsdA (DUF1294 family)